MIDIHTHIIPNLDDGPPDMGTSVGIGRIAAQEGVTAMISTSHSEECTAVGYEGIKERLESVRTAWEEAGINIRLETGMEIFLVPDTVNALKEGELWALAGSSYVLVELPYQPWPIYAEQTLFNLQVAGYVPILAHPERYTAIQSNPNLMYSLAERGVLGQVTAGALLGDHGGPAKRTAETLIRHNLAQFLSSDSHGTTPRKRPPLFKDALRAVEAMIGSEAAQALVTTNPQAILDNKVLTPEPEQVSQRKWSIGRFFRRQG